MYVLEKFYPNTDSLQCFDWIEDHKFEKGIADYNKKDWDYISDSEFIEWYNRVLECCWKTHSVTTTPTNI
jgi:hypothetical protein